MADNSVVAMQIPPSERALRETILDHLKECETKKYRRLKKNKELEEYIALIVSMTTRYANNLMESGVFSSTAWFTAIRETILGAEPD